MARSAVSGGKVRKIDQSSECVLSFFAVCHFFRLPFLLFPQAASPAALAARRFEFFVVLIIYSPFFLEKFGIDKKNECSYNKNITNKRLQK